MKLSVRWIFDHIDIDYCLKEINIPNLINIFNSTSAEVESIEKLDIDLDNFTLAQVIEIYETEIKLYSFELKKEIIFSNKKENRKDIKVNDIYLVKINKEHKLYSWASLSDFGSSNTALFTKIWSSDSDLNGAWKNNFESWDYIITIDNKTITHRPDMWGHRGFAREFAALLDAKLLPEEDLLASKPIKHYASSSNVSATNPITIEIEKTKDSCGQVCRRFSGLYFKKFDYEPSVLSIASRLAKIDSKPIDLIVDLTNYIMFDLGQPMHAFDANKIKTNKIITRCAHDSEKITLLDGEKVTLTSKDYVITNGQKPIALAGIMGGLDSAVTQETDSIFLESANFEPIAIRQTATRIKKRTESSVRFEKNLDPNQNTQAILRFLKLADKLKINYQAADTVISIGSLIKEKLIKISHKLIVNKLGLFVSADKIEEILTKIGFGVQVKQEQQEQLDNISLDNIFIVTVPTFRATKDITIAEDIIEEIARFIGYSFIPLELPSKLMTPFDLSDVMQLRAIKKHMAYGIGMHEVQTYAFFDEEFLKKINYEPNNTLDIANPQSQNYKKLVSSLVPNLLKSVYININKNNSLRFFECNRVWFKENNKSFELQELAGIFFEHKKPVDFYEYKDLLNSLFNLLEINIEWRKPKSSIDFWYNSDQTAELLYQNRIIGTAGKASSKVISFMGQGDAFIFELDANFLINIKLPEHKFKPLAKYPEVDLDISLLVLQEVTAQELSQTISSADERIKQVNLIDFYQKEDWNQKKSLTFRFIIYDKNKTLVKEEIDQIWSKVVKKVESLGAIVR